MVGTGGEFQLRDGAQMLASSVGTAPAGDVSFNIDALTLTGSGTTLGSASTGTGTAGGIRIKASRRIALGLGAALSVSSASSNAGDIHIQSDGIISLYGASVSAQASVSAGNVSIAGTRLELAHGSLLSANSGRGTGGNITLTAPLLIRLNSGSQIVTNSVSGDGGNIAVDPIELTIGSGSGIHANGGGPASRGGRITIGADVVPRCGAQWTRRGPQCHRNRRRARVIRQH